MNNEYSANILGTKVWYIGYTAHLSCVYVFNSDLYRVGIYRVDIGVIYSVLLGQKIDSQIVQASHQCMRLFMVVCKHACMYLLYACMHICMHGCMNICM